MVYDERIKIHINHKNFSLKNFDDGKYVLYWMQQSQRVYYNHSLDYGINLANQKNIPLLVYFCISPNYPYGNIRNYTFMIEGLIEVGEELIDRGIGFEIVVASPEIGIEKFLVDAAALVMDKGYLSYQRIWRNSVLKKCYDLKIDHVVEIDSDLVVPVEVASDKVEYAARTIRPKIHRKIDELNRELKLQDIKKSWDFTRNSSENIFSYINDKEKREIFLNSLSISKEVLKSKVYEGGYNAAIKIYDDFLNNDLERYEFSSPVEDRGSKMGMYLHFGQISALDLYRRLMKYIKINPEISITSVDSYIEQLIVRRELAFNFVYYTKNYDKFEGMTDGWAYETMAVHGSDVREYNYSLDDMITGKTHDEFWNDAMLEMVETGYMNNYMRMYWCKKIIEWTPSFEEAYEMAVHLNNTYFLDGRDPNSYTGIAWCFGKHDHGWKEREIFGKLRYMNDKGLIRKFGMKKNRGTENGS